MGHLGWLVIVIIVFFVGAFLGTKYPNLNVGSKVL